jgi:hypothetical protein
MYYTSKSGMLCYLCYDVYQAETGYHFCRKLPAIIHEKEPECKSSPQNVPSAENGSI